MKTKILTLLLIFLFVLPLTAAPPHQGKSPGSMAASFDNSHFINANSILMFVTNQGSFSRDLGGVFGHDYGCYYPFSTIAAIEDGSNISSVIFASGLWIGAIDSATNETRVTIAEYSQEFKQGPYSAVLNGELQDDLSYRVYKIFSDSAADNPNDDWTNWPVSQGAPVDGNGDPLLIGDQTLFCVYNDGDTAQHANDAGNTKPLGLEVRQTTFAFSREGSLANIVFLKFQIYNKGSNVLNNMYVSLWSDPDLGGFTDDLVGCDTLLSLGYCYNENNNDESYGSRPPAVGYDFFQGPLVFTGDNADTAKMWDTTWVGYQNMPMSSFDKYINGTDPQSNFETYNYMQGLNSDGTPYVYNNDTLKFFHSGDPVTGTGDIDVNAADRRFMLSVGPITFRPGDSTEIIAAIIVGRGSDRLNSITVLKNIDDFAQKIYDNDFNPPNPPAKPVVQIADLDRQIVLTWGTDSEDDPGDFPFEGYTVYQGETNTKEGPWKKLANYDVINGVTAIVDSVLDPDLNDLLPVVVKAGSDNGLKRFYESVTDEINGVSFRNLTEYYYKVEAYSYDSTKPAGEKTLTSATIVTAMPQGPIADEEFSSIFGDTITTTHAAGGSDGIVTPTVIDPSKLTGDTYSVVFVDTIFIGPESLFWSNKIYPGPDTLIGPFWHLFNSSGDTLLFAQTNQTGNDDYITVDGILVKVAGPAPGFKSFQVVANAAGTIDPPVAGAFDFRDFPTPGGTNPPDEQQVGEGHWAFHTGDNGGSSGGGDRGPYDQFIARTFRNDQARLDRLNAYDWEMRFTGSNSNPGVGGGYAIAAFTSGKAFWVPFELWRIGIGTPDDPSDDLRLIPWIFDDGGDSLYYMSSWGSAANGNCGPGGCEHSASGADNDPYTDWIYWAIPADGSGNLAVTGGDSAYMVLEDSVLADPTLANWPYNELRVMDRTVLINWNGDTTANATGGATVPSGYNQDLPEQGTIFRLLTTKPNTTADTFTFTTQAPTVVAKNEDALDKIKAVPNPYYLFSSYDNSVFNRVIKFHNLPATCTIRIFNLGGDLIKTIEKDDATTPIAEWDVQTENSLPVASGIYIYIVEAPGFGEKVGKMAIFTEVEVLKRF